MNSVLLLALLLICDAHDVGVHIKKDITSNESATSRVPALFVALSDGDGARLMIEAAQLLSHTQDFNCSVIIVVNNPISFSIPRNSSYLKIYQINTNASAREEPCCDEPLVEQPIAAHLSACTALLQDENLIQHFRKSPPRLLLFPGFLHDACSLNIFRETAAVVWSTGAVSSAWLGYATNAVPFSVHQAPLQSRASSSLLERLEATGAWSSFTRNVETRYWQPAAASVSLQLDVPALDIDEAYSQVSLMMSASHVLMERPSASLPMRITVGCFHCRPARPLPQEVQEWVLPRRAGMIVILLPKTELHAKLVSITARDLPQFAFLWLGPGSPHVNETEFPANLVVHPTCPEQDALGHSRARLVLSSCSETEVLGSVFHGIPVVCLPCSFDQHVTANRVLQLGVGIIIPTPGNLLSLADVTSSITGNTSYRHAARHLGVMMRDEPETAADRLVFWCGHLARHWGHGHEDAMLTARQAPRHFIPLFNAALVIGTIIGILVTLTSIGTWRFIAARQSIVIRNKKE